LLAQHLDLTRGELTGEPTRLAEPIGSTGAGFGGFSVSGDGRVVYRGGGAGLSQLRRYDRMGKVLGVAGDTDASTPRYPELSPDGGHIAFQRNVQSNTDVWLMDLLRGGITRFTFDPAIEGAPLWSPDGMRIAFVSAGKGPYDLYAKPANGAGAEEL